MSSSWRMVGSAGRDGLVPLEHVETGERLAAEVRGGIAWPWPVPVGARLVAAGAVVVVAWAPADRRARLVSWRTTGTVGPVFGADQWPVDGGVVGALREGSLALGCWRWYSICATADQEESLRTVRRRLPDLAGLRVTALDDATADDVRAMLFRWTLERRLARLPDDAVDETEREEGEQVGPRPLTAAIAAALESLDRRPWRASPEAGWEPLPRNVVAGGY